MLVALRKESVDRNITLVVPALLHFESLSARRAWIEIDQVQKLGVFKARRSPQGERG